MGSRLSLSDLNRSSRRRAGLSIALGAALSVWASTAEAAPSKPKNAKARGHFDRAVELYTAKDYDGAIREAEAGYELEPNEGLLFLWAQAERLNGNCVDAVPLFNSFIEMTTNEDMKQNALQAKGICAEELAASARQTGGEGGDEPEPEPEGEPDIYPVEPEPTPRGETPWYRDPLGGALVGVGGTSVLVGVALLISAGVLSPDRAPDYGTFVDRLELQPKLLLGGGVLTGVGMAVATAGGVRWWLLSRKQSSAASQARVFVVPWAGRNGSGVGVTGRF